MGDTEHCSILFDLVSSLIHSGIGEGVPLSSMCSVGGVMYSGMGDVRSIVPYQFLDLYAVG